MSDIEIKIEFNEKLIEFLIELGKPRKYEAGYVQANKIVNDGLNILGMNASDILGFAKSDNDRRVRRVRGSQAFFKNMYDKGWRYAGNFEYEGLLNNGFVVMERELPNKTLDAIREELEVLLRDKGTHTKPNIDIDQFTTLKDTAIKLPIVEISTDALHPYPTKLVKVEKESPNVTFDKPIGKAIKTYTITEKGKKALELIDELDKAREPKEGFESDVNDFMLESKKEMKTLEEIFFDETGKNAMWHGKETKNFKSWKEGLENGN